MTSEQVENWRRQSYNATCFAVGTTGLSWPPGTHVFLCGNPAMIGVPVKDPHTGQWTYPRPPGVVELLEERGFQVDRPQAKMKGNIHFEEYW